MIPEPVDDATLERYVLGRLEGTDLDAIESWLLDTPDAPALVDAIELELVERYLDGDLPPIDRAGFVRALRERPALAGRLTLVEGLRARARAEKAARPLPFVRPERARWTRSAWVPASMAAGFVAAAGLAAWLQVERTRLESEVRRLQAQAAAPAAPAPAPATPPVASAPPAPLASVVAVTLTPGVVRSVGAVPLVTTTGDTQLVRLALRVPPGTRPLRAELVDGDLVERLRLGPLTAIPEGAAASVTLDVPASAIPPGDYQITLRPAEGGRSPAYTYTFRVIAPR